FHLTPSIFVYGAWAFMISQYSGESDVVFGITSSGRPADLPGVESIVGLLVTTLPLRVSMAKDETILSWLRSIQDRKVDVLENEHCSLVDIQGWSDLKRGQPLFESIVVFENFPVQASIRELAKKLGIE